MKKTIYTIIAGMTLILAACDIETSNNGDLDGLWQLTAVDTLATGGHTDMRISNITWAVQGRLLEFKRGGDGFICLFTHEGGHLLTGDIRVIDRDNEDPLVSDVHAVYVKDYPYPTLAELGINALPEDFKVITLTSSKMVLESSLLCLSFRKY